MPDIGAEARKAIDIIHRNYGGHIYLDDGRCAGWFDIPLSNGSVGSFTLNAKAAPGSICPIAQQINAGNRTGVRVVLTDSFPNNIGGRDTWQALALANSPFKIRQVAVAKPLAWGTRFVNAFRNAFISPTVTTRGGTSLFGVDQSEPTRPLLSNQYRSR